MSACGWRTHTAQAILNPDVINQDSCVPVKSRVIKALWALLGFTLILGCFSQVSITLSGKFLRASVPAPAALAPWLLVQAIAFIALTAAFARRSKLVREIYHVIKPPSTSALLLATLAGPLLILLVSLLSAPFSYQEFCSTCWPNSTHGLAVLSVLGWALMEELWHRGLFLTLKRYLFANDLIAVLASGLLFSIAHKWSAGDSWLNGGQVSAFYFFATGVLFATIVIRWRSIWIAFGLHAGLNVTMLLLHGNAYTVGAPMLSTGNGPQKLIFGLIALAAAIAIWPRNPRQPRVGGG